MTVSNRRDFLAGLLTVATGLAGTWRAALAKAKPEQRRAYSILRRVNMDGVTIAHVATPAGVCLVGPVTHVSDETVLDMARLWAGAERRRFDDARRGLSDNNRFRYLSAEGD